MPLPLEIYSYILRFMPSSVNVGKIGGLNSGSQLKSPHSTACLLLCRGRIWCMARLKCYTTLKAPPKLVCMKNTALGGCLETNTALSFALCCICLLTRPLVLYFPGKEYEYLARYWYCISWYKYHCILVDWSKGTIYLSKIGVLVMGRCKDARYPYSNVSYITHLTIW